MEENEKRTVAMNKIRKLMATTKPTEPEKKEEMKEKIMKIKRRRKEEDIPKRSDDKIRRIYNQQKYTEGQE